MNQEVTEKGEVRVERLQQGKLWLIPMAPMRVLLFSSALFLLLMGASIWLTTSQPWLGLELEAVEDQSGVLVQSDFFGRREWQLGQGVILGEITAPGRPSVPLSSLSLVQEPDNASTYQGYNAFFTHLEQLNSVLNTGGVEVLLEDGRWKTLEVLPRRSLTDLPFNFWIINLFAAVGFFYGIGVWSYRRGQISSRILAIGGVGFMVAAISMAAYSSRELGFSTDWYLGLATVNHLGNTLFSYSAMILLWYYPRRLGNQNVALLGYVAVVLFWLNEALQILELPVHAFYLASFLIPFVPAVIFARYQWIASRQRPVERASLLWLLLAIFVSTGVGALLYIVPTVFNEEPLLPLWLGQLVLLGLYLGLVLGTLKVRLFDVERWWFGSWIWFLGGGIVVSMDFALVYYLNANPIGVLSVVILLTAWLYLPARHWLWRRLFTHPTAAPEDYLPELMDSFFEQDVVRAVERRWPKVLTKVFEPLSAVMVEQENFVPALAEHGLCLYVPAVEGNNSIKISGRNHGNRLFSRQDVQLADTLLTLVRQTMELRKAREESVRQERDRIRRDLHDDVGSKLLTLVHRAGDEKNAELARNALQQLRETIYALDDHSGETLEMVIAGWRSDIKQRLHAAGVEGNWDVSIDAPDFVMSARMKINLTRIIQEAVSNALKHAKPQQMSMRVEAVEGLLKIQFENDGTIAKTSSWIEGTGMSNMRKRSDEIGATINWVVGADVKEGGAKVTVTVKAPLGRE
ncbi:MAG: hypothetical protein ABW117_17755 [Candidatus Sedimenticola sp. 1PA]